MLGGYASQNMLAFVVDTKSFKVCMAAFLGGLGLRVWGSIRGDEGSIGDCQVTRPFAPPPPFP